MKNSAIFALLALAGQGYSAKVNSMRLAASRNVTLQAFRALDKNRDGGITMDELEVGILDAAGAGLTCEYHICTDGFRAKSGVKKLRGNTDGECCDETCLRDPCSATGFRQRPDAAQLLLSESKCCEKTCAGFDCPNGWKVRNDPEKIVDPSEDVCCYKTCELHICGDDTLTLRGDAALVAGETDGDCCVKTCTGFACSQAGFVLRADADSTTGGIGGNSDATCCVKSCSLYECPRGRKLVENAASIIADSENTCCQ